MTEKLLQFPLVSFTQSLPFDYSKSFGFLGGKKHRKNILKNKWNHKFMLALVLVGELKNKYFYSFTKFLMKISKIEKDVRASQVI